MSRWSWSPKGIQWKRRSRGLRHGIMHVTTLSHGLQHVPIKFISDVIRWFLNHWLRDIYGVPSILSFEGGFDGCGGWSGGRGGGSFLERWMGIKEIVWIIIDGFPHANWCHRGDQESRWLIGLKIDWWRMIWKKNCSANKKSPQGANCAKTFRIT